VFLLLIQELLQVHRSLLIRDKSTFNNMFSLEAHKPDGVQGEEGENDENPIHLQGDTADEIRALMWCFYALCVWTIIPTSCSTDAALT
jgi:hypothetical protein